MTTDSAPPRHVTTPFATSEPPRPPSPFGTPVSERFRDPAGYQASESLQAAVGVALLLGMPLLLTGEPGCGKTSLAGWLAWKYHLPPPLVFNVKSTTTGRDLLYEFDELARFRDAQAGAAPRDLAHYLRLNALGLAILLAGRHDDRIQARRSPTGLLLPLSQSRADLAAVAAPERDPQHHFGQRLVVLIDELDKAPRDTPNDLLHEILEMNFQIRELDTSVTGDPALRPMVVITSNSEKSLPEPFLRRCVFHHIATPDAVLRREIVQRRMHPFATRGGLFDDTMRFFEDLSGELGRAPGTAELLAWLSVLEARLTQALPGAAPLPACTLRQLCSGTLGTLAKTREDLDRAERLMQALPEPVTPSAG